jgi:CubicO group peptidase (beta-lactamase class C family)
MNVEGFVAEGFEPVRVVAGHIAGQDRAPFAVAAWQRGRWVVDLRSAGLPPEALFHTWSVIKPVVGTCLLDATLACGVSTTAAVRSLWPQLRAAGDGRLRITDVLSHAAGLVTLPWPSEVGHLQDWDETVAAIAEADPDWPPGTAVGEHVLTYGHLAGELVRRLTGHSLGRYLADRVSGPIGLDLHVGLTGANLGRVVNTVGLDERFWRVYAGSPGTLRHRAVGRGCDDTLVNSTTWRQAEVPAVNGHATARAVTSFYAAVLAGTLPDGALRLGRLGRDLILGREVGWSLAGGQLDPPASSSPDRIGMGGLGGQAAGAFPRLDLSWAFLTARPGDRAPAVALENVLTRAAAAHDHSRPE